MACLGSEDTSHSTTTTTLGKKGKQLLEAAMPGAEERLSLAGTPYQGPLIAALSDYEQQGLNTLDEYLKSALPTETPLYGASEEEILKTIQGTSYDPIHGDYYQAYRNQVIRELEEAKDRLAARASAGDKLFGGGRISTEGELEESAIGNMLTFLGSLQERERERRLGAIPQALEILTFGENAPLQRVSAAETLGALPRELEQAQLTADYQEWLRELTDLGIPLDTALQLVARTGRTRTDAESQPGVDYAGIFEDILRGGVGGLAAIL